MTTLQALSLLARNTLTYIPVVITFTDIVGTISVVQGESMQVCINYVWFQSHHLNYYY